MGLGNEQHQKGAAREAKGSSGQDLREQGVTMHVVESINGHVFEC